MRRLWWAVLPLLLLLLGTALREGKTARAKFDREDDDFAEFDFDPEAEEGEGECS